jgi:anti-sigma factor RsiW
MTCKEALNFVDSYLDHELDLVRQLEIEQHLKECSACSHAYAQRRSLQTAIKGAPLYFETPPKLEQDVRRALRRAAGVVSATDSAAPTKEFFPRLSWNWGGWLAGAMSMATVAAVLIGVGPRFLGTSPDDQLSQEVTSSHVRSLITNHLIDIVTSNQHVVKPWFNGRIDFSPSVRDFSDHGFPLAGGRLDYLAGRTVAVLVYHRAAHPINLFIWPSPPGEDFKEKTLSRQGYHLIHWSHGGMTYWVISDVNEMELKDFAELVQK